MGIRKPSGIEKKVERQAARKLDKVYDMNQFDEPIQTVATGSLVGSLSSIKGQEVFRKVGREVMMRANATIDLVNNMGGSTATPLQRSNEQDPQEE